MNLFLLSLDPQEAAEMQADVHVVKMTLETLQMLYTALHCSLDPIVWNIDPYKVTHINHPCNLWVRASPLHFWWTLLHGLALAGEYERRYHKNHKCMVHYKLILERMVAYGPPKFAPVCLDSIPVHKIALGDIPRGCLFFPLAVADDLYEDVAVHDKGVLQGCASYRNYYKTKETSMKRKMSWSTGEKNKARGITCTTRMRF